MLSGYSLVGGPPFIPMKATQWRMKPKWLDFLGLKIPGLEAVLLHHFAHRTCALETLLLRLRVIRVEPANSGFLSNSRHESEEVQITKRGTSVQFSLYRPYTVNDELSVSLRRVTARLG